MTLSPRPFRSGVLLSITVAASLLAPAAAAQQGRPELPDDGVRVSSLTEELEGGVGGVAVDRLGFVYSADFGERVYKISPFGEVEVLVDHLYGTSGNAIDSRGRLLQSVFSGNELVRVNRDGTVETLATGLGGPVGIAVDPDDTMTVCSCRDNVLRRVRTDGTVTEFSRSDLYNCPNGIVRHPDGDYYVVNFSDGRMIRVDAAGAAEEFATIPGSGNGHVAWANGSFWVTGFRSNRLYRVDTEGGVETYAGTGRFAATDGARGEAEFASPNGIAYDATRDALYVNDYLTPFPQRNRVPRTSMVRKVAFPSLTAAFLGALDEGGTAAAERAYRDYRATRPGRFTELEMNAVGYRLLQEGRVAEAVAAFRLNVESYPQSFNVYDSLGEGLKAAGDRSGAIENYRKSLELNPRNSNARAMLEELDAAPAETSGQ